MTDSGRPGQDRSGTGAGKAAKAGKQERLAARLRENLRKRKAQSRARAGSEPGKGETGKGEAGPDEAEEGGPDRGGAGRT